MKDNRLQVYSKKKTRTPQNFVTCNDLIKHITLEDEKFVLYKIRNFEITLGYLTFQPTCEIK